MRTRFRRWRLFLGVIALLTWSASAPAMDVQTTTTRSGAPVLLLQGRIVGGDAKRLRAALQGEGRVALFVLNSPGGSVLEAQEMAKLIRASGAPALVPGNAVCASACFMLLAAAPPGRQRLHPRRA